MKSMPIVALLLAETFGSYLFAAPRGQTPNTAVEQQVTARYHLTVMARNGQIANAGSVLVLRVNGLLMYTTANPMAPESTYKNGKISRAAFAGFGKDLINAVNKPGASAAIDQRTFMAGEKLLLTKVAVQKDGLVLRFYSDPSSGTAYFGELKFPFPKNTPPPVDRLLNTIAEVFTVQPDDVPPSAVAPPTDTQAPAAAPAQPVVAQVEQPSGPPPTLSLGLTIDEVVAILGQPERVADLGTKKLYVYKDMKVTFINGKVSDIE